MRRLLAALGFGCLLHGGSLQAADEIDIRVEARQHFKMGVAFLEAAGGARYEQAYEAFLAAYQVSPSPKILGNLGLCAMMLERDGEAIAAYDRYLREVDDIEASERVHIERELRTLRERAVPLTLEVSPADVMVIDRRSPVAGAPVMNRYPVTGGVLRIQVRAGQHEMTVERAGYTAVRWTFEAAPGGTLFRRVELARPVPHKPPPSPTRPADAPDASSRWGAPPVVVGLVVTGALAVASGVAIGVAASNHAEYDDARQAGDKARGDELRDGGETKNLVANTLVVSTVGSAAITALMLILWPTDKKPTAAAIAGPGRAGAALRAAW